MHYGWVIAAASLVIGISAYGAYFSFTLFYPPLVAEFGWSRTAISGALSAGLIGYGLFALPMGWCADKFGPRITIACGGVLFGVGTSLGAWVSELWHLYALYGGLTAVGMGGAWAPLVSTLSRWFERRRGLAIGIGSIGGGTGPFFIAPIVEYLLTAFGWRMAYAWLGLLCGGLIVGAALLLYRDPQSKGLLPYGAANPAAAGPSPVDRANADVSARDAAFPNLRSIVRTQAFWWVSLMFGLWWFAGAIVYVQLAPFVIEKGFDLRFAAFAVMAFGAGNGIGKIVMGIVSDTVGGVRAYQITTIIGACAIVGIALVSGPYGVLITTGVFGFGLGGATPQLTTVCVEMFGLRAVGALMGTLLALIGIVGAGGPVISGWIFDTAGSYAPAYLLGGGLFAMTIVIAATLGHRGAGVPLK